MRDLDIDRLRRSLALNHAKYRHVMARAFPWQGISGAEEDELVEDLIYERHRIIAAINECRTGRPL